MPYHPPSIRSIRAPLLIGITLCIGLAGCNLPRDPDGTLNTVRNGTMRVGVIANPPWVSDSGSAVGGVEGQLADELASRLHARVQWVRRPAAELMLALQRRELDMVIGGLTDALPWTQKVAFTRSYYTDTIAVGAPPGVVVPTDLRGQTVAVQSGNPVAADIRAKGATPQPVDDVTRASGLVAAPTWQLASMQRANTGIVLAQDRHVIAAPRGENAWLVQIERLLRERKSAVPAALRAAPR